MLDPTGEYVPIAPSPGAGESSGDPGPDPLFGPPPFPPVLFVAAALWALVALGFVAMIFVRREIGKPWGAADAMLIVSALFFLKDAYQLVRGQLSEPGFDGWCSVLYGVLALGLTAYFYNRDGTPLMLYAGGALALALVGAGGLVLWARKRYLTWMAVAGR